MDILIKALLTGLLTGIVFAFFKLPIPAPTALAGVLGVVGIYVGYVLVASTRG